jgi:hypothetical protein
MKILGLDLSLNTGWSFGDRGCQPQYGLFTLPGFSEHLLPRSCASLYSAVQSMVRANNIEGVVIEAPLQAIYKKNSRGIVTNSSSHGIRALTMISGAAQAAVINGGAKHLWMPEPATWRKSVLGSGYPDKPKEAAFQYCKMVLGLNIGDDNSAEAACLVEYGHGQSKLI